VHAVGGELEVEHRIALGHVQAARGQVGDKQAAQLAGAEGGERAAALRLAHAAVQRAHGQPARAQLGRRVRQPPPVVEEDERALRVQRVHRAAQHVHAQARVGQQHELVREAGREAGPRVAARRPRRPLARRLHARQRGAGAPGRVGVQRALRERGADQHRLAAAEHGSPRVLLQPRHVAAEGFVQQLVRLVQHQRAHVVRAQVAQQAQLGQPPGRAHHQQRPVALQRLQLALHVGAAYRLHHVLAARGAEQRLRLAEDLDGQLLAGRNHHAQHRVAAPPALAAQRRALLRHAGGEQGEQVSWAWVRRSALGTRAAHRASCQTPSAPGWRRSWR